MPLQHLLNALRPAPAKLPEGQLIIQPAPPHGPAGAHASHALSRRQVHHDKGWLPPRTK